MTLKTALRFLAIAVGSLVYWHWAQAFPILIRIVFFGDCLTKTDPDRCILGGDVAQVVSFVVVGLIYSLILWWALEFQRVAKREADKPE